MNAGSESSKACSATRRIPVLSSSGGDGTRRTRSDGGESWVAFTDRVRSALQPIRTKHPSGAILIVGHGGTNQAILQILFGLSLDDTRSITQANDELYLIELDGTGAPRLWKLVTAANLRDL